MDLASRLARCHPRELAARIAREIEDAGQPELAHECSQLWALLAESAPEASYEYGLQQGQRETLAELIPTLVRRDFAGVALEVARQMGVPATERSAFLDNDPSPKAIQFQIERLLGIVRHSGSGVGICHPNERALNVLKKNLHRLKRDFRMVHVSELAH